MYSLGSPIFVKEMNGASPNNVWYIRYNDNEYVLRQCKRNHDYKWLQYIERINDYLLSMGFPVQPILKTAQGNKTVLVCESYWQLSPFICGYELQLGDTGQINKALNLLIRLHNINYLPENPSNPNESVLQWLKNYSYYFDRLEKAILYYYKNKEKAYDYLNKLSNHLENSLASLNLQKYHKLKKAYIHGDFHRGNILFRNTEIVAILDFDTFHYGPRILDVALATLQLTKVRSGSFKLDSKISKEFFSKYSAKQHINEQEQASMVPLLLLYLMPTEKYIYLLAEEKPHLLNWYMEWSLEALTMSYQLKDIIKSMSA
ncbi:phosphotransferase [Oceanobacillus sp. CFH 90083]|uniref:phosphotransferase n=1 Tax=Oceanobacillus sp. CFH 90083 TaxID=2592336 RepID=UPI001D14B506|nr:phosphotransferase [Oceanobacillus sp. CFH 90083]